MTGEPIENSEEDELGMVRLDPVAVTAEMRLRGWSRKELSRKSRVSQPTIRAVLRGTAVRAVKARAIRQAFRRCPPDVDELVAVRGVVR